MAPDPDDAALERLAEATDRLAGSTDSLLGEVQALARSEARLVVRRSQQRQRALQAVVLWAAGAAVIVAVLTAATLIDTHTHRAHVAPLESRVEAIEALIAQVDAEISDGRLPDLEGDRWATGHLPPLIPAAEQNAPPIGISVYIACAVGLLLCGTGWSRARRQLSHRPPVPPAD